MQKSAENGRFSRLWRETGGKFSSDINMRKNEKTLQAADLQGLICKELTKKMPLAVGQKGKNNAEPKTNRVRRHAECSDLF